MTARHHPRSLADLSGQIEGKGTNGPTETRRAASRRGAVDGSKSDEAAMAGALTETESCILKLVALGMSNRDIADELSITVGTTKWHVHHIFQKLGVPRRTAAVCRALEMRLLDDE